MKSEDHLLQKRCETYEAVIQVIDKLYETLEANGFYHTDIDRARRSLRLVKLYASPEVAKGVEEIIDEIRVLMYCGRTELESLKAVYLLDYRHLQNRMRWDLGLQALYRGYSAYESVGGNENE